MSAARTLAARHWVFDLDGTLTVAIHDFDAIRRALQIPPGRDILVHLQGLAPAVAAQKHAWLHAHELALAQRAQAAPGAASLLARLHGEGAQIGVLTRNARDLALITLAAAGLECWVSPDDVLGRDEMTPKPDTAGLHWFARRWKGPPAQLRMVGDSHYDLDCGRAAGVPTVLLRDGDNPWPVATDWHFADCAQRLSRL